MTGEADFSIVWEVEAPRRPDLSLLALQMELASAVSTEFLVPDSHLGRATLSSLAVANEVQRNGGRVIACLNARDRNLTGLRRDLLTAAAYRVRRLLCVHGDVPARGGRSGELSVRTMIDEIRGTDTDPAFADCPSFEAGVASAVGRIPEWKLRADFLVLQVSFATDDVLRWRDTTNVNVPVFAGVMVLRSPKTAAGITGIRVPPALAESVATDPMAGVHAAGDAFESFRAHGGFAGVHLVPMGMHGEVSAHVLREARVLS